MGSRPGLSTGRESEERGLTRSGLGVTIAKPCLQRLSLTSLHHVDSNEVHGARIATPAGEHAEQRSDQTCLQKTKNSRRPPVY